MALRYVCKKFWAPVISVFPTKYSAGGGSTAELHSSFSASVSSTATKHTITFFHDRVTPDGCPRPAPGAPPTPAYDTYVVFITGQVRIRDCADYRLELSSDNGCSWFAKPYVTLRGLSTGGTGGPNVNMYYQTNNLNGSGVSVLCDVVGSSLIPDPFVSSVDPNPSYWRPPSCQDGFVNFSVEFNTNFCNNPQDVTIVIERV